MHIEFGQLNMVGQMILYFPTQLHFLIGGEHVMCGGLKLANSLGQTKLTP